MTAAENNAANTPQPSSEDGIRCTDIVKRDLPCYPCPHNSICCRFGTYLTEQEGLSLLKEFGSDFIYRDTDRDEWRTQVWNGRCVFFADGGCKIHRHPQYPSVCAKFPWADGRKPDLLAAWDAAICPETAAK